jgi:TolA-binding protein
MARAAAAPVSRFSGATPEQWLLAIEDLKRQGKHEEAQRELTEFRKRYPNYRIPEAITEKFETR